MSESNSSDSQLNDDNSGVTIKEKEQGDIVQNDVNTPEYKELQSGKRNLVHVVHLDHQYLAASTDKDSEGKTGGENNTNIRTNSIQKCTTLKLKSLSEQGKTGKLSQLLTRGESELSCNQVSDNEFQTFIPNAALIQKHFQEMLNMTSFKSISDNDNSLHENGDSFDDEDSDETESASGDCCDANNDITIDDIILTNLPDDEIKVQEEKNSQDIYTIEVSTYEKMHDQEEKKHGREKETAHGQEKEKEKTHGQDKEKKHGQAKEKTHGQEKEKKHGQDKEREKTHGQDKEKMICQENEKKHGHDKEKVHGQEKEKKHGQAKEKTHGQEKEKKHGQKKEKEKTHGQEKEKTHGQEKEKQSSKVKIRICSGKDKNSNNSDDIHSKDKNNKDRTKNKKSDTSEKKTLNTPKSQNKKSQNIKTSKKKIEHQSDESSQKKSSEEQNFETNTNPQTLKAESNPACCVTHEKKRLLASSSCPTISSSTVEIDPHNTDVKSAESLHSSVSPAEWKRIRQEIEAGIRQDALIHHTLALLLKRWGEYLSFTQDQLYRFELESARAGSSAEVVDMMEDKGRFIWQLVDDLLASTVSL